jgi:hypothetical protein
MLCSKGRVGSSPTTGTTSEKGNAGTYPKGARAMSNPPIRFELPRSFNKLESGWRSRLNPNRQNETLSRNI